MKYGLYVQNVLLKKCMLTLLICLTGLCISMQAFAADNATLSFKEADDKIEVTAAFDTAGLKVISQGIITAETTGELTLETQGRKRIVFRSLDTDGCCVLSVPATEENKNTMFRAFLIASGNDGEETVFYSEQNTPAKYLEYNTELTVDNIRYHRIEDGFEVLGVVEQMETVVIPEQVEGKNVVKIAENAFENDTVLTEIDLPNTIQVIGKRAFAGCTALAVMK